LRHSYPAKNSFSSSLSPGESCHRQGSKGIVYAGKPVEANHHYRYIPPAFFSFGEALPSLSVKRSRFGEALGKKHHAVPCNSVHPAAVYLCHVLVTAIKWVIFLFTVCYCSYNEKSG
jgi:hypothetical protein